MNASEATNELATALASAQAEMKNAPMNRVNPHFKNKYADLAAIRDTTLPTLNKHGISLIQATEITDAGLVLATRLSHKSGQFVESVYPLPTGAAPQVLGSALTYARRYSWASICGIAAEDDDDAEIASTNNGATKTNGNAHDAPITSAQLATIRNAINEVDADESLFTKYLKVPSLDRLPASRYDGAMAALDAKRAKVQ